MSYADKVYMNDLLEILTKGQKEEGDVRPHWPDGAPAPTIRIHDVCNKYDLQKEFPILTCRPVNLRGAMDEMCWIYQKKSNNIQDLHSHVWDQWADETGSIGKTYGYQAAKKYDFPQGVMDQVDRVLHMLQHDPLSRHIIINLWNPADYREMHLAPCCCWLQFNVMGDRLNMVLYQRSLDMMSAGGWDVTAHSTLLMMIARHVGLKPGTFTHFVSNMHIYDRHVPLVRKLLEKFGYLIEYTPDITNPPVETLELYDAPVVEFMEATPTDFYQIQPHHLQFKTQYSQHNILPKFEVAI